MPERRHPSQTRRVDRIEEGYYSLQLVRGGWPVPCRIGRTDDRRLWYAVIDECMHAPDADPWLATGVSEIHTFGLKIGLAEYDWRIETKLWAEKNDPNHPALSPRRRIDVRRLRPLTPRTPTPSWTPTSRMPP